MRGLRQLTRQVASAPQPDEEQREPGSAEPPRMPPITPRPRPTGGCDPRVTGTIDPGRATDPETRRLTLFAITTAKYGSTIAPIAGTSRHQSGTTITRMMHTMRMPIATE